MYGLLKAHRFHLSAVQKYQQRLHYCGTCKTLGRIYGQRTRMLLNHDAVFLGELLTALTGTKLEDWAAAYQSYNCLARPQSAAEMPLVLQYAATANLLLTEFKLADQHKDSGRKRWWWLQWMLRSPFQQAAQRLMQWQFPLDALQQLNDEQDRRENALQSGQPFETPEAALRFAAAPTTQATAMFFAHGATLMGLPQLSAPLAHLGAEFGLLIYVLDALEDYDQDVATKEFNAIRTSYQLTAAKLPRAVRETVVAFLLHTQDRIVGGLSALPLPPASATLFAERLRRNLAHKLAIKLPVVSCALRPPSWQERWQNAVTTGQRLMQQELTAGNSFGWVKAPLVFATILAIAFLSPRQSIKSWRECLELSVNLMFWGGLPAAILAMVQGSSIENEERRKNRASCFDSCDCCQCCDGCCDCSCGGCCDNCCGCDCSCDC